MSSYASASDHAMHAAGEARLTEWPMRLVGTAPERDAALAAPRRGASVTSLHAVPHTAFQYVRDGWGMTGQASDLVHTRPAAGRFAEDIVPTSLGSHPGRSSGIAKTRVSLNVPPNIKHAASTSGGSGKIAYRPDLVASVDAASGALASATHRAVVPRASPDAPVAQTHRTVDAETGSAAPESGLGEATEPWPETDVQGAGQSDQKTAVTAKSVDVATEQPIEGGAADALRAGKFSFPDNLLGSLEQGIEVPVRLKTATGSEEAGRASIKYADGDVVLTDFGLSGIKLKEASKQQIAALHGTPLSVVAEATPAAVKPDTVLAEFNLRTFEVLAQLPEEAYAAEGEARSFALADSTEKHLSGVLNYDVSGVKNARSEANGYLHVKSVTGYGVYHAYVDGDVRTDSDTNLYEARIERDFNGFNVTGGYLGTWAMSVLGQTTFLPGGKFFGVSAGNTARSEINDGSLARTPLFAFMPASGEVQIHRDGKLINVQRLSIGNQEIDTRQLPVGTYAVRVDVVVNGRVVSSKEEQVYKPGNGGSGKDTQYQFFGGQYVANSMYGHDSVAEPLVGASGKIATRFGTFYGSSYYFHGLAAAELRYQRNFKYGSLGIDSGFTTDGGFRLNANGASNYGPVSGWVNHMVTTGSSVRNGIYNQRTTSFGGNVNVSQVFGWKKSASLGLSASLYQGSNQDYRLDWNQDLYTNKWMRVSLSGGQMFSRDSQQGRAWNKAFYVGLNASFSFGDGGIDYSRSRQSEQIGAHFGWKPTRVDGLDYVSAGVNHSRALNGARGNANSTQANLSAQGHNHLFGWQGNVSLDDTGDLSGTAAAQGTIGWNAHGVGFTSKRGESGVIVGIDKAARGQLELTSASNRQSLNGRSNFVPLTGYKAHTVQIRTRRDTPENFDIQDGEAKLVLYPGNVASIRPKVRRLVTVFGVLTENGTVRPNTEIQNHIGKTVTDAAGGFVIDVDTSHPSIQYRTDTGGTCKIDFDLSAAQGAVWVNEVSCEAERVAKTNADRQREG